MDKVLIINCSYKKNGNTAKLIEGIKDCRFPNAEVVFLKEVSGCYDCNNKNCYGSLSDCNLADSGIVIDMYNKISNADIVVFATPVYLNLPTPKLLAFLSRLNTRNDEMGRDMFDGKQAYILVSADVSGTQQTASVLMNALNMLGFGFRGKCILENIVEWKTKKVRGGFLSEDIPYVKE